MLARDPPAHGRIVAGAFGPHPLIAPPHLQTLMPALLRPTPELALRLEYWERPDGDFVRLGWVNEVLESRSRPSRAAPGSVHSAAGAEQSGTATGALRPRPLVILLHGLTGGFDSKYLRGLARQIQALGWRAVAIEFRGAGPEPNRLPRFYHHGDTADLRDLVLRLRAAEPQAKLLAVGWSLGGNVLLKYLGETGAAAALDGAVAVCPPFSIRECAEHLRRGFARVYQNKMLFELKLKLKRKAQTMRLPIDLERALASQDFFDYDNAVTAPLNDFADAGDYYARSACGPFLKSIERPTLIIHAKDDPFMTPAIIPSAEKLAPQVTLELCERGGHVGFIGAGRAGLPYCWLEQRIPEFLREYA